MNYVPEILDDNKNLQETKAANLQLVNLTKL